MGALLEARCRCGYVEKELRVGVGAGDTTIDCRVPAFCPRCKTVLASGYLDSFPICPKCRAAILFYNEDELIETPAQSETVIFSCRLDDKDMFRLKNNSYFCPKCGSQKLHFSITGYWE